MNHIACSPSSNTSFRARSLAAALGILLLAGHPSGSRADDGNTIGSATLLSPGTRSASLTTGDEDWFCFTVAS